MIITKELLEKTYYEILNERKWLNEIDYQKEWLTNPESYTHPNNVLAQCPAAGKSNTITIYLEIRFRLGMSTNPTLLFSAAETLLKLNMYDTFKSFKPSFKYIVINNADDITKGKKKGVNVYITLPQMFTEKNKKNSKLLPKLDLLITDEAHIWFLKNTIQKFIKEQRIKQFVELTGSPYLFNLANQTAKEKKKEQPYRMCYVTTNDLLDRNRISNVKIELITTPAYNFTHKSFVGNYGNLKSGLTTSKKRNRHLLESVLEGMLLKCKYNTDISIVKNKTNVGIVSKLWHNIGSMFSDMGQTILTCDSIDMAEEFYKILINNSETKDMVLVSHSKNDPKSENFFKFEKNPKKYKLLIVVDRGQLGYNYLELFNIVDFTFSTNITTIHQRLNRVTRKSKLNVDKQKMFFKVSTNELEGYYKVIMSAVLHLNEKYWYENYNTKNLGQLPLTLIRKRKGRKQPSGTATNRKTKKVKFQNFDDLELLDIDLFKGILHNADGAYETYGTTTIDEVRREFFNIDYVKDKWNKISIPQEALKYNSKSEFAIKNQSAYNAANRLNILDDVCKHMKGRVKITHQYCRDIAKNYSDRALLTKENIGIYNYARKNNIWEEITSHMKNKEIIRWNNETITKVAKKCKDFYDFIDNYNYAYKKAKERNLLNKLFPGWEKLPRGVYRDDVKKRLSKATTLYHITKKKKIVESNKRKVKILKTIKKNTFTTNDVKIICNQFGLRNPYILLKDEKLVKQIGYGIYQKIK